MSLVEEPEAEEDDEEGADNEALVRAHAAEEALAERTAFFASLGHELKTPLNAILGFSDLMRNELRGDLPEAGPRVRLARHALEHDPHWMLTIGSLVNRLKIDGLLLLSCASCGYSEHGVETSTPTPGYYRNLTPSMALAAITDVWERWEFLRAELTGNKELQIYGRKRG